MTTGLTLEGKTRPFARKHRTRSAPPIGMEGVLSRDSAVVHFYGDLGSDNLSDLIGILDGLVQLPAASLTADFTEITRVSSAALAVITGYERRASNFVVRLAKRGASMQETLRKSAYASIASH